MFKIKNKAQRQGAKILIYGTEKIGKTTFGVNTPNPILMSVEDGARNIKRNDGKEFDELDDIDSWDKCMRVVQDLTRYNHDYKTLVIDSIDWLERRCHQRIIGNRDTDLTRVNGGFQAGPRDAQRRHSDLLYSLDGLQQKRGMNIVAISHYQIKKYTDPLMEEGFDMFMPKCEPMVSALWREWSEAIIFVAQPMTLRDHGNPKKKTRGGECQDPVAYTVATPQYMAGNRYGLPAKMKFGYDFWDVLQGYINTARPTPLPQPEGPKPVGPQAQVPRGESQTQESQTPDSLEKVNRDLEELLTNPYLSDKERKDASDYVERNSGQLGFLTVARDRLQDIIFRGGNFNKPNKKKPRPKTQPKTQPKTRLPAAPVRGAKPQPDTRADRYSHRKYVAPERKSDSDEGPPPMLDQSDSFEQYNGPPSETPDAWTLESSTPRPEGPQPQSIQASDVRAARENAEVAVSPTRGSPRPRKSKPAATKPVGRPPKETLATVSSELAQLLTDPYLPVQTRKEAESYLDNVGGDFIMLKSARDRLINVISENRKSSQNKVASSEEV